MPNSPSALPMPHDSQIVPRYASRGTSVKLERQFNGEGGRESLHFWRSNRPRDTLNETAHRLVRKGLAGRGVPQDRRSAAMTSRGANANRAAVKRDIYRGRLIASTDSQWLIGSQRPYRYETGGVLTAGTNGTFPCTIRIFSIKRHREAQHHGHPCGQLVRMRTQQWCAVPSSTASATARWCAA